MALIRVHSTKHGAYRISISGTAMMGLGLCLTFEYLDPSGWWSQFHRKTPPRTVVMSGVAEQGFVHQQSRDTMPQAPSRLSPSLFPNTAS